MRSQRLLSAFTCVVLMLSLAGCGGGGVGDPIQGGSSSTGTSTVTTVVVGTGLAAQARDDGIARLRFTGRDARGQVVCGPVVSDRVPQVVLYDVPVSVVAVLMECLDAQGRTIDVFNIPVALSAGRRFVVEDAYQTAPRLASLAVNPTSGTIAYGTTAQFTASGRFSDGSSQDLTSMAQWSSSTPAVATVSDTGLAPGLAAGTTTISATLGPLTGTAQLTVNSGALQSIALTPSQPTVPKGRGQQFQATGTFSDHTTQDLTSQVTWSSSNEAVATISNTAGSQGRATVTADSGVTVISATLAGITGQTSLTGSSKVITAVTVEGTVTTVARSQSIHYTATATYSDSTTGDVTSSVTWTSGDSAVATVSDVIPDKGLVTGTTSGSTSIRATDGVSALYGERAVTVTSFLQPATSLPQPLTDHRQVLLNNGTVLIFGGRDSNDATIANAWTYNPATDLYTATGQMATPRYSAMGALLPDGCVLVAGGYGLSSAEVYDPEARSFSATAGMTSPRVDGALVPLPTGKVMVIGGYYTGAGTTYLASVEIYDPSTHQWSPGAPMAEPRCAMAAVPLADGRIFLAGGYEGAAWKNTAEIYDPARDAWTTVPATMSTARQRFTGTLLQDGSVLLAGGASGGVSLATAEVFNPGNNTFTATGNLVTARASQTATALADGRVLMAGGVQSLDLLDSTEIYDPLGRAFTASISMTVPRVNHQATLLRNGNVLVTGGVTPNPGGGPPPYMLTDSADLFLP